MDIEEQLAIVRMLQNEDIDYVEQGIFIWETLIVDGGSFFSDLSMMTTWEDRGDEPLSFDALLKQCSIFPHKVYFALWAWCKLLSFPELRDRMELTSEFSVVNYGIDRLPENIVQLQYVEKLRLSFNKFTELPEELGELVNLVDLDLSFNQLEKLPESIGNLKHLRELNLMSNNLREFPESIGGLEKLVNISLVNNLIKDFPNTVSGWKNLYSLDLGGNKLFSLPKNIEKIASLQKLFLGHNSLEDLPEEISQLENLELIYLRFNQFKLFPNILEKLPNLRKADLVGNLIDKEDLEQMRKLDQYKEYASLWDQVKIWHIVVFTILFWAFCFLVL